MRCALIPALMIGLAWGVPEARADTATLRLVQINDIYKMSEDKGRGGFARLAAVVKAERAKGGSVLVLHAGDTLSPSIMSGFDQGESIMALTNRIRPDVFVPGNHEYDFGKDVFLKRMGEARFPLLAANLRAADGTLLAGFKDNTVIDVEGVKVGIIGATAEDSATKSSPGDLKIAPTFDTVQAEAGRLKDAGADLLIAVVHANAALDWRMFDAKLVDVIITGDDHDLRVEYNGERVMVESGADAQYVVVTELQIDRQVKDGKTAGITWRPRFRIIDTADVTPDPDMLAAVNSFEAELGSELDVEVATLDQPLDSRTATVRAGETAIGNLVTDAMREAVGADVALMNSGGIRGNKQYAAGSKLTRRDVLSELPFGNRTAMVELTGSALLAALENGVSKLPGPSGHFPQVSGLSLTVDLGKPAGSRITRIEVGGKPLDPARSYKVALNDFMLRGGDNYSMLASGRILLRPEDGKLLANDVMVHARKLGRIAAKVEGRIALQQ